MVVRENKPLFDAEIYFFKSEEGLPRNRFAGIASAESLDEQGEILLLPVELTNLPYHGLIILLLQKGVKFFDDSPKKGSHHP